MIYHSEPSHQDLSSESSPLLFHTQCVPHGNLGKLDETVCLTPNANCISLNAAKCAFCSVASQLQLSAYVYGWVFGVASLQ